MEQWFLLRLTVTGYGVSHVLPGAVATTMTYRVLRRRGLDSEKVGLALAAVSVFIYGALGVIAGSLAYMLLMGNLGPVPTASSFLLLQRVAMNLNRVARWTHAGIHTLGYQDVIDESHCQAGSPAKGSGEANISAIRCTRLFGEH